MGNVRSKSMRRSNTGGSTGSSGNRDQADGNSSRHGFNRSNSRKKNEANLERPVRLVATDSKVTPSPSKPIGVPGLVMEKGGYDDVIRRMETGRKEEQEAMAKAAREQRKRLEEEERKRKEKEDYERELKEKHKLTQALVGRFEAERQVKVNKEVVNVQDDQRDRLNQVIAALEQAALEKKGSNDRQNSRKKSKEPFQMDAGALVQKRMRSYKRMDKAAKVDPIKAVDESDERWERESSLQKDAKVRKMTDDICTREQQKRDLTRMADELKHHFDLDAVLAAAGVNLELLINEQPEEFLRLYYRSRDAFGKDQPKRTQTTHAQLQDAIKTSMANLQAPSA
mmetsp:Transcript_8454/g.25403  ORF Transcript_8454/g.25403 Transcript_8454/m.25403 type:complete len:340 (+) Transcript_8454:83-1102(+)|eukprot:CAMPEP_0198734238 /NCGR_PEP_ID=MMETSP1475-20131203/51257_1 /TAXON_ID= ORGANISM="Unidentified sp., Strain CCMP1999" /NCGR_SAMPLE_ID=MMETSP1475 /ASSEMBLY_ACC=CAM_ASM_001111 /LENGTH=339 /DNA_ID=CAMNT_0044497669 /DNA_START=75 /DNA_END=1094 /DNA_ORIENTATION=+